MKFSEKDENEPSADGQRGKQAGTDAEKSGRETPWEIYSGVLIKYTGGE